jgi:hypothetical protein
MSLSKRSSSRLHNRTVVVTQGEPAINGPIEAGVSSRGYMILPSEYPVGRSVKQRRQK